MNRNRRFHPLAKRWAFALATLLCAQTFSITKYLTLLLSCH